MKTDPLTRDHAIITPWSENYTEAKFAYIRDLITDADILKRFQKGGELPAGYGIGIDERCIEYPWFFAQIPVSAKTMLDAGSTLNHEAVVHHPALNDKDLHILTLSPEGNCFWKLGISYLFSDLRSIPIRDEYYDVIVSISTLEHVGMDNSAHTGQARYRENRPTDFILALRELWRVLKPRGRLFITLPFGKYEDMGFALQFDSRTLKELLCTVPFRSIEQRFYRYSANGWQSSNETECGNCRYVEWVIEYFSNPKKGLPQPIPEEKDLAAAARAVACLQLTK